MNPTDQSSGKKKRIMIVAGGGLVLLIISILFIGWVMSGDNIDRDLVEIAQRQEEIARIADIGTDNARGERAKSVATTTNAAMGSSQRRVVENLARKEIDLRSSDLSARENASTTNALDEALQANRFDTAFLSALSTEILGYRDALERAYNKTRSVNDRELLDRLHEETTILLNAIE